MVRINVGVRTGEIHRYAAAPVAAIRNRLRTRWPAGWTAARHPSANTRSTAANALIATNDPISAPLTTYQRYCRR